MAKIVIVQPYVPTYRAPLFEALGRRLHDEGHDLVVASGEPTGPQSARLDSVHLRNVTHVPLRVRVLRAGRFQLRYTRARSVWRSADVVIVELAAGSIASYGALLQRRRAVGVWGHVGAYVTADTRVTRALRRWQARRADRVLAYTERGARTAEAYGVPPHNITVLHNTIDTSVLQAAVLLERGRTPSAIRAELGVSSGPVFAMIGGVDATKRVDLVVDALDILWSQGSSIQLIVGGHGELDVLFAPARARGQVRMLGYVDDAQKGRIARVAIALVNPGRVGLIAVESMVMALPLITTKTARHGPEFDYLTPEAHLFVIPPNAPALAQMMVQLSESPSEVARVSEAIEAAAGSHTLDMMVTEMVGAVSSLVHDGRRVRTHPNS
ncbi:glycosyltransferase family 4 protein [Curtobacterium sp. VKM Ac-2865]|uniref:glycosyltransferase family 4 protein n=1 Tax=Curtobacterium sp. VKM Ac-2865 TaxID=2783817 RepID=UPI00188AD3BF|nr:glycosyltransferase family 4 protein [Curtobacterium sp. VKM Ac-2865]MBF4582934.1 glycosyltransferase family 4 protein [Curtobacterium sp. VKM Ac-2865]